MRKLIFVGIIALASCSCPPSQTPEKLNVEEEAKTTREIMDALGNEDYKILKSGIRKEAGDHFAAYPDILIDRETGCEYFWENRQPLSVRYDTDGKPKCKGLEK